MFLTFFFVCLIFTLLVPIKGEEDFLGDDDPRVLGLGLIASWSSIAMPCHPTAPPAAPKTSTPHHLSLSSLSRTRARTRAKTPPNSPNLNLIAREWSSTSSN